MSSIATEDYKCCANMCIAAHRSWFYDKESHDLSAVQKAEGILGFGITAIALAIFTGIFIRDILRIRRAIAHPNSAFALKLNPRNVSLKPGLVMLSIASPVFGIGAIASALTTIKICLTPFVEENSTRTGPSNFDFGNGPIFTSTL